MLSNSACSEGLEIQLVACTACGASCSMNALTEQINNAAVVGLFG